VKDRIERILRLATAVAAVGKVEGRTAVRRVVGTSSWKHDDERKAAADAKRQRKQQRNIGNAIATGEFKELPEWHPDDWKMNSSL
jgi:hypothetical protein